jgi:hypothetical protein
VKMATEPRRSTWQSAPVGPPNARTKAPVSLMGLVWKLVFLAALGVGGYFMWLHAPHIWSKVRLNSDVESASIYFIRQIPRSVPNEGDLKRWVQNSADDKLKTHLAFKARWYVAYGPRGDELKVVRDDEFLPKDKEFFAQSVESIRRSTELPGVEVERLEFPRGTMTRTVTVDGAVWIVVAGWTEEMKDKK